MGKPRTGQSYYDILKSYPKQTKGYLFVEAEWDKIIERIKSRTGKTDEDIESLKGVKLKYEACQEHKIRYLKQNEVDVFTIENNGTKEQYINKFFEMF